MIEADLILYNAETVWTCAGPAPRRGVQQRDAGPVSGGAVAALSGRIVFVGSTTECRGLVVPLEDARQIDVSGCTVVPGFVDPHTHVVYAGNRVVELHRRLQGIPYAEIAAEGGGIMSTVRATRAADEDTLVQQSRSRLAAMLRQGTTTCEVKSGYGLDVESELRMLRAIRRLADQPIDLVPTFLGAHEIPDRARRREYIETVINQMIPIVTAEALAEWCDVFCEEGVYTPQESVAILRAGQEAGLKARLHADEFAPSGGAQVAAQVGARSADHLIFVDNGGISALKAAGVVATLLPTAALSLKLGRFAPARALIDEGVAVALGSDVNPGGGVSSSMPFAMTLGCFAMGMTLEEALVASTLNASYALDRHQEIGSLEPGKSMDVVVLRGDVTNLLRAGEQCIETVIKKGSIVVEQNS